MRDINSYTISALAEQAGAVVNRGGILPDDWDVLHIAAETARQQFEATPGLTLIEDSRHQSARFTSPSTRIDLVLNNDPLSCSEAMRIIKKMHEISIPITRLLLNRCRPSEIIEKHRRVLEAYPIWRFPQSDDRLTGLPALEGYLHRHTGLFTIHGMAVA